MEADVPSAFLLYESTLSKIMAPPKDATLTNMMDFSRGEEHPGTVCPLSKREDFEYNCDATPTNNEYVLPKLPRPFRRLCFNTRNAGSPL